MNHTKKIALITLFFAFIFTENIFSIGAGAQIGAIPSIDIDENGVNFKDFEGNLTGTVHLFRIPAVFGFGVNIGKDSFDKDNDNSDFVLGLAGFFDYWISEIQLDNIWNLYTGFGFYGKVMMDFDKNFTASLGPRFFVGTNWLFIDNYVEYYAQMNIVPTYVTKLTDFAGKSGKFRLCLPLETGVRLHF